MFSLEFYFYEQDWRPNQPHGSMILRRTRTAIGPYICLELQDEHLFVTKEGEAGGKLMASFMIRPGECSRCWRLARSRNEYNNKYTNWRAIPYVPRAVVRPSKRRTVIVEKTDD